MTRVLTIMIAVLPFFWSSAKAEPGSIETEVIVEESADAAWRRWTTADGLQSFFGRQCDIDRRVDGLMNIWFFPNNPPGARGAEGMRILALEPERRLVFTWDAPPNYPYARANRAMVEIRLTPEGQTKTKVRLRHFGFGDTHEEWWLTRAYFEGAWPVVLRRLQFAAKNGKVDWDNLPANLGYVAPERDELYRRAGIKPGSIK